MSKKLYEETNIQNIASAIREKNGTETQYTVAQMPAAVRAIPSREPVLQEKTVNQNGIVLPDTGYDGLSKVTIAIPSATGVTF